MKVEEIKKAVEFLRKQPVPDKPAVFYAYCEACGDVHSSLEVKSDKCFKKFLEELLNHQ